MPVLDGLEASRRLLARDDPPEGARAHDVRRGGVPLRGAARGHERLPAEGLAARAADRRGPHRRRRQRADRPGRDAPRDRRLRPPRRDQAAAARAAGADRPRARGAAAAGARALQPGDRRRADRRRRHGQDPRRPRADEARPARPSAGRGLRLRARDRGARCRSPDAVAYVRAALPPPPARVLEIGAGDGELAARPARAPATTSPRSTRRASRRRAAGRARWTSTRRRARSTPRSRWSRCTTSSRSARSLRRLSEVMRHGARLVVDEFDVDRLDERAVGLVARPRRRGQAARRPRRRDARAPALGRARSARSWRRGSTSASRSRAPTCTAGRSTRSCATRRSG